MLASDRMKAGILIILAVGLVLVVAYKRSETKIPDGPANNDAVANAGPAAVTAAQDANTEGRSSAPGEFQLLVQRSTSG